MATLRQITRDALRVLTFREPSREIAVSWQAYLLFGLVVTWVAGVGRYWDSPRADLWQHLGLGSVAYVFVLAFILWVLLIPLKPQRWSYRTVLIFITFTSPPALLYAIPVERFMSMGAAQSANAWFLAAIATWRVALLVWFLRRIARLPGVTVFVATLLPLTLIVVTLSILNLEHVVFDLMAGIAPEQRSPGDMAYSVVLTLAIFSMLTFPLLLVGYAVLAVRARRS